MRRSGVSVHFLATPLHKSAKLWQKTYFYVRNLREVDYINLPDFAAGPPVEPRDNW